MFTGVHPAMSFDLAKLASHEQALRLNKARLIAEANHGSGQRASVIRSIRATFGGAMIAVGHRVRGERGECVETSPSAAALRIAR